ncbi:hypothetical protein HPB52_025036 [Rhipicephalus sanguineus]|uniref:Cadherin domain-containing protein n=1 Tax=Rhipicephalus sanguineus TaxID=34632 RepID=A0A9D4TDH2_RHISA|nr:hypothetical protein HPB52_025036 [Rhipicephalus sanguineus]
MDTSEHKCARTTTGCGFELAFLPTLLHRSSVRFLCRPSRIRYEITQGNIGGAFAVKNETGAIYVAGPLDYETRKEVGRSLLPFFAAAGASDNLNDHTTVLIKVKDVNDNAPILIVPTYGGPDH